MFRILVVEDNPADFFLLKETFGTLSCPHSLDWVKDGAEALDFLDRRESHADALRPDLVLMDINMPGISGLEALRTIKRDPELCMIPILMLSTSAWPDEVRESYQVHANSYVQKPTTLERAARLVRAIESFWIDFAISPGPRVASPNGEARSRAKSMYESATKETVASRSVGCADHRRLLDEFGAAVQELLSLHDQQFHATVQGDSECNRFDLLIHMANEKKQLAKYAYMRHLESHGCSNFNVLNETRT